MSCPDFADSIRVFTRTAGAGSGLERGAKPGNGKESNECVVVRGRLFAMGAHLEEHIGADLKHPEPDRLARAEPDRLGDDLAPAASEQDHAADLLAPFAH